MALEFYHLEDCINFVKVSSIHSYDELALLARFWWISWTCHFILVPIFKFPHKFLFLVHKVRECAPNFILFSCFIFIIVILEVSFLRFGMSLGQVIHGDFLLLNLKSHIYGCYEQMFMFWIFFLITKFLFDKNFKVLKNMNEIKVMSSIIIYYYYCAPWTNWIFVCVCNDSNGLVFGS